MRIFISIALFSLLLSFKSNGQVLNGTITDEKGNPIAFSTIFVREISQGAVANEEGNFKLELPSGKYTCIFQSLGYQQVIKQVDLKPGTPALIIKLPLMVYDLSGVTISGKEDPAYRIMRNVISRAPYYSRLVKKFNANVYIKGTLHINSISRLVKWMAKDDIKEFNIKEGDTYLEESVNEIQFTAPDITKQKVISMKSTFPKFSEDQSGNAMGFIIGNIYETNGFGAAISPLRPGAFKHYNYRYEGRTNYDSYSVHKVKIIPKGKGAQYVGGTIYVVDGLWCISNIDISKEEQMGVKLHLTQNYNEVRQKAWLPVSNRLRIEMDLMGNSGSFDYHTTVKYKSLELITEGEPAIATTPKNVPAKGKIYHEKKKEQLAKADKKIQELQEIENPDKNQAYKLARLQEKKEELRVKDSLRHDHEYIEKYKQEIDSNARKQDSVFWNSIRPIPLTDNEIVSLKNHDSLVLISKTVHDTDSVKVPKHKFNWISDVVVGGVFYKDSLSNYRSKGLINPFSLQFNVVDGFKYHTTIYFNETLRNKRLLSIQPMIGYAFSRKKFFGELLSIVSSNIVSDRIGIRIGSQAIDYNTDGIHPLESTIEGLIFHENPARFYLSNYINILLEKQFSRAIRGSLNISVNSNKELENVTSYTWFFKDSKNYEPNILTNNKFRMRDHENLSTEFTLKYKPMPFYFIKDGIKIPYEGFDDFPEFSVSWLKGYKVNDFDTDFDFIKASINQQISFKDNRRLSYMVEGGYFLNTNSMWFPQFQHFAKRPLIAGIKEFFPYFLLLDSYKFSTNDYYLVSHLQYKSPFFLLKKLPGLRNRLWNESLFFSYLYTPDNKNYMEPGYGIGNLLFNLGVFAGFNGTEYQQVGIRLAILLFGTKEISF